ncbi:unnamed protein product [Urochloa humidicola]
MAFTPATACCNPSLLLAPRASSSRGSPARAQAQLLCTPTTSAFRGLRAPAAVPAPRWRRAGASTTGIVCGKVTKGSVPPNFTLKDQNGKPVSLNKFKGKPVVVYFYPADETPGCTKQQFSKTFLSQIEKQRNFWNSETILLRRARSVTRTRSSRRRGRR